MIGSQLLSKIMQKKDQKFIIYGFDNLMLGKYKYIMPFIKKKNFFFYNLDVSKKIKKNIINNFNYQIDELWMLAANSDIGSGNKNNLIDYKNTFLTTKETFDSLRDKINSSTTVNFTSSSAVYGNVKNKISEKNISFRPTTNYGLMKLLSEKFLNFEQSKINFKLRIFRFPNVIGENLTHGILFDFLKKAKESKKIFSVLGNGNQQKPYSHVDEIINSMLYLNLLKKKIIIVNLGYGDTGIKVKDIVKIFFRIFKLHKKIKYGKTKFGWRGDVVKYSYSVNYLKNLGYKFKLNSEQSIIKCLSDYNIK